ncbi:glycosyltransferase family 1 protein [Xanthomonas sacchari]|uniref:GumK N-terminal domain-containing glycosyltransferase n=1 Tax=Xanthomonas sacchari TaxID=56458 RepID=UPI003D18BA95
MLSGAVGARLPHAAARANIHFIADELAKRRPHALLLAALQPAFAAQGRPAPAAGCHRQPGWSATTAWTAICGARCCIRSTPGRRWLRPLEDPDVQRVYAARAPATLIRWMREADVIVFESGIAVAFIALAARINPTARKVYRASDGLSTINVADYIEREFDRVAPSLDVIALVSPAMAEEVASRHNVYHVGHGVDHDLHTLGDPSPYGEGIHAVAVGSMLFDPEFFVAASRAFPQVTFHVIGSGMGRAPGYGDNVVVYGEMKHAETIRYIKHARFGIAPYASEQVPAYLADSSMKLLQYDFFGLPAVCPNAVVGRYPSRFGYTPADEASIVTAIGHALQAPHVRHRQCLSWSDTTDRVLDPAAYPETRLFADGVA